MLSLSVCVDMCLDVNEGGTNRSRYTQTCDLACADLLMNPDIMPKPGQSDLLCRSKSPAEKEKVAFSSHL